MNGNARTLTANAMAAASLQLVRFPLIAAVTAVAAFTGCAGFDGDEAPATGSATAAASVKPTETPEGALARLQAATGDRARSEEHKATGGSRFLQVPAGAALAPGQAKGDKAKADHSRAFFRDYGVAIGVADPGAMRLVATRKDRLGETHLTWKQFHAGLPVFGTMVKTHYDASDRLKAVNGTAIPDVAAVSPIPTWSSAATGQKALASVLEKREHGAGLRTGAATLLYFREGLAQGLPGPTHLAWEIEVTDGAGIRDHVYVSAHNGKIVDTITAVHDEMYRRAYNGNNLPTVPSNYPSGPYWFEGRAFPTPFTEANNMIQASKETYDLFAQAFGRDSFDGAGRKMDSIFNRGYSCPNASWNGTFISFCPGFTTDDVTAHEWGHAYTQHTHGLIYQWQPGALNESYSDIWGEVVDMINGRDNVGSSGAPGDRTEGECSSFSPPVTSLLVGDEKFLAQSALFGATLDTTGITENIVAAVDVAEPAGGGLPAGTTSDGCSAPTNAAELAGKIALVDRGRCEFGLKALNMQQAGAVAVIVANNAAFGLPVMGPGAVGAQVTIYAIGVQQSTGATLRTMLGAGPVVGTMLAQPGQDASARWLMGEDVTGDFNGALRDMWNPTCYANPGKVSDPYYWCTADDAGGVHFNSGIPNHAFALLVDGGDYNATTIGAIGLTKAAHIYFRAQDEYQVYDSDFVDHAWALRQSCSDLVGQPLNGLKGGVSPEVIGSADCDQVDLAIEAVELEDPAPCAFVPNLTAGNPSLCHIQMTSGAATLFRVNTFDAGDEGYMATTTTSSPTFTPREWELSGLPSGRAGQGWFGETPGGGTCTATKDETGLLSLTSPELELPANNVFARALFDHWVGLEPGWDGGNLRVSVNSGPWQLVPPSEFVFNNYQFLLFTAAQGNTNPLAGQPAFTGTTGGSITNGSWGRSLLNLGNFARAGDKIRLRWDLGTDGCAGRAGWYLDTMAVYSCTPRVPELTVADIAFPEGDAATKQVAFTVRMTPQPISGAPAGTPTGTIVPVTVNYEIVEGSAIHGNDFDRVYPGTAVIPASTNTALFISVNIPVTIKGDKAVEGDETFTLRITGVTNATMTDREATATIVDDDVPEGDDLSSL